MRQRKIHFVGAGPGNVELITIKGRRLLDEADCIVYAGSLINVELLAGCKADLHDSAGMNLEEILHVMSSAWKKGENVVRLHTGDPAFFGAIKEQMQGLDALGIPYTVVPGVSAASRGCRITHGGIDSSRGRPNRHHYETRGQNSRPRT